jgi:hypothetical protein
VASFLVRILLVILPIVFCAPCNAQEGDYLDLTAISGESSKRLRGPVAGSTNSSITPVAKAPLKLELLWLNDELHYLGDDVFAEVRVENVGLESLSLPWSGDYDQVRPEGYELTKPPGFELALLSLSVSSVGVVDHVLVGQVIAGSHACIGSLRVLRPGESVRIKVRCRLDFMNQEINSSYLARAPITLEIRALLAFLDSGINGVVLPIVSIDSLKLRIGKRQ